jgi:hypothetical protein
VVSKLASAPLSLASGKGAEQPNPPATGNAGPSERHLKKQGLEALVAILKSLVVWGTASTKSAPEAPPDPTTRSRTSEDNRPETLTPDPSTDRLSLSMHNDLARLTSPTVELADDPMKFENAKHKKTTLLEGIRKFNLKPKRVCPFTKGQLSALLTMYFTGSRVLPRNGFHQEQESPRDRCVLAEYRWTEQGHDW